MAVKKNPEVDNERLRVPLIFLGFFIVGSLITLSFSFKNKVEIVLGDRDNQAVQEIPEQEELVEEDEPEPVVQEVQDLEVQEEPTEEIEVIESTDEIGRASCRERV